jgi:tRNA nucleotidyltransferase (CCA-adding enzyme)
MTQFGVGQMPVVGDDEIIGVVTRTDLIKLWGTPPRPPPRRHEIAQKIEAALPAPLLDLLHQASELAQGLEYPLYVVGGFVRDLLLGKPTLDMDLVVEGEAIKLARRVARRVGARTRRGLCHSAHGVLCPLGCPARSGAQLHQSRSPPPRLYH